MKRRRSVKDRADNALDRAAYWLAEGNEARDAGKSKTAERCYERAQRWHDRYNKLAGRG